MQYGNKITGLFSLIFWIILKPI